MRLAPPIVNQSRARLLLCLFLLFFCAGCANSYKYNGISYASSDAALRAQNADLERIVSRITPALKATAGKALVILPGKSSIYAQGIIRTGIPGKERLDFVASSMQSGFKAELRCPQKRKLFASIEHLESDLPSLVACKKKKSFDVVLYRDLSQPAVVHWFLLVRSAGKTIPMNYPAARCGVSAGTIVCRSQVSGY